MYPVNRQAISAVKLAPSVPYARTDSTSATASPMATTTTVSVSISVVDSTSTASRPGSDVDQASTTVLPASVSALHKELTCRDCGSNITPVRLHVVAYFSQHLQKQGTVHAKDKRKVKPQYYGEALTRDEMVERIEEAEGEERAESQKEQAKKEGMPSR